MFTGSKLAASCGCYAVLLLAICISSSPWHPLPQRRSNSRLLTQPQPPYCCFPQQWRALLLSTPNSGSGVAVAKPSRLSIALDYDRGSAVYFHGSGHFILDHAGRTSSDFALVRGGGASSNSSAECVRRVERSPESARSPANLALERNQCLYAGAYEPAYRLQEEEVDEAGGLSVWDGSELVRSRQFRRGRRPLALTGESIAEEESEAAVLVGDQVILNNKVLLVRRRSSDGGGGGGGECELVGVRVSVIYEDAPAENAEMEYKVKLFLPSLEGSSLVRRLDSRCDL